MEQGGDGLAPEASVGDGLQFRFDPRHLGQSHGKHGIGVHLHGRKAPDRCTVALEAIGILGDSEIIACATQIFLRQEVAVALDGGVELLRNDPGQLRAELRAGIAHSRRVEGRLADRCREKVVELPDHVADDHLRAAVFVLESCPEIRDFGVDEPG